jgi:hypothetical protein
MFFFGKFVDFGGAGPVWLCTRGAGPALLVYLPEVSVVPFPPPFLRFPCSQIHRGERPFFAQGSRKVRASSAQALFVFVGGAGVEDINEEHSLNLNYLDVLEVHKRYDKQLLSDPKGGPRRVRSV